MTTGVQDRRCIERFGVELGGPRARKLVVQNIEPGTVLSRPYTSRLCSRPKTIGSRSYLERIRIMLPPPLWTVWVSSFELFFLAEMKKKDPHPWAPTNVISRNEKSVSRPAHLPSDLLRIPTGKRLPQGRLHQLHQQRWDNSRCASRALPRSEQVITSWERSLIAPHPARRRGAKQPLKNWQLTYPLCEVSG